ILLLLIFLHSHGWAQGVKSTGKADSAGNTLVDTVGHNKASYRFSVTGQTPIAGVIAALCGSSTTTVRVTRATWSLSTTATTEVVNSIVANKRSTADSA